GVLGQVERGRQVHVAVRVGLDLPDLGALVRVAPLDGPPFGAGRVRDGGERGAGGGGGHGAGQGGGGQGRWGGQDLVGVAGVVAVEADHGVQVHRAPGLVLGGLVEGQPVGGQLAGAAVGCGDLPERDLPRPAQPV